MVATETHTHDQLSAVPESSTMHKLPKEEELAGLLLQVQQGSKEQTIRAPGQLFQEQTTSQGIILPLQGVRLKETEQQFHEKARRAEPGSR